MHKTANVLNKLPKSLQAKAKRALQNIWMAETRHAAEAALETFIKSHGIKYDKAVACLTKDREALFAFYDFPAEHWRHLRTTNPIESRVCHRSASNDPIQGLPLKQDRARDDLQARASRREDLAPPQRLCPVLGAKFNDGIEVVRLQTQTAAA